MSSILTPTAPVPFCIYRLRQSVAEESRFSDADLLGFINDGYISACERSQCLQSVATLTITAGTHEVALPFDWSQTLKVYQSGRELRPIPYRDTLRMLPWTYYQYEGWVGASIGDPDADTTLAMLYARLPAQLDYGSTPEWGPEWNRLLRHYAAWRCTRAAGGAQQISKAVNERRLYELGVRALRWQNRAGAASGGGQVKSLVQTRVATVAG